jgi:hypothetical protein
LTSESIREPKDCTDVNNSEGILYAGPNRHFRDNTIVGTLDD